jgi:tetratricopeptide (TPR) repeat protein
MYGDAVKSNEQAVAVDEVYLAKHQPTGAYPMMYYPHNIHFLWAALTMEGRSADAIKTATRMSEKLTPEMVKEMAIVEYFLPVRWYALTKFGKWDEMLQEKGPPEELTFARGIWHYARGKAFAGKDHLAEAAIELAGLEKSLAATPQDTALMRHSTPQLLAIAQHDLAAALSARAGVNADAIAQLRVAVLLQDQVLYDEPPPWYTSERVALAKVLLNANKAEEAEAVLREDLKRSPHSGWALFLLEKAVRAQNRAEEADQIQAEFEKAWARADFTLQ